MCAKKNIWNPAKCSSKNGIHFGSIIGNSAIMCVEIIDTTKTVSAKSTPTISLYFTNLFINYHSIIDSC